MTLPFKSFRQVAAAIQLGVNLPTIPFAIDNLDGNGITMSWEIERHRMGPETGTITIVNLSRALRESMYAAWKVALDKPKAVYEARVAAHMAQSFVDYATATLLAKHEAPYPYSYQVAFSIGWESVPMLVYLGDVINMRPSVRQGEDVHTILEIGSRATNDAVVGQSFAEVTLSQIYQVLVHGPAPTGLGLPPNVEAQLLFESRAAQLPVPIWDSLVAGYKSSAKMLTDLCYACQLQWRIHNGRIQLIDWDPYTAVLLPPVLLSPLTGLGAWDVTEDGGVELTALANPEVLPGSQIVVADADGVPVAGPAHRVEAMAFTGTTEGESLMKISARKALLL